MIGPELEKLILNGEAVFKTATIGIGALTQLYVPNGKSFVITDITIQPFANILTTDQRFANSQTLIEEVFSQTLELISKRSTFQLLMYNSRGIQNRWSFRNEILLKTEYQPAHNSNVTRPEFLFTEKKISLYALCDTTIWFYFLFPDFSGLQFPVISQPFINFFTNIDGVPPAPFSWDPNQSTAQLVGNAPGPEYYSTTGLYNSFNPPSPITNASNSWNIPYNGIDSGLVPPGPDPTYDITTRMFQSLPLLNISYVEINKRTTTQGIS